MRILTSPPTLRIWKKNHVVYGWKNINLDELNVVYVHKLECLGVIIDV
jgi:hypothetical protein